MVKASEKWLINRLFENQTCLWCTKLEQVQFSDMYCTSIKATLMSLKIGFKFLPQSCSNSLMIETAAAQLKRWA